MNPLSRLISVVSTDHCFSCGQAALGLCEACSVHFEASVPQVCYRCNGVSSEFRTCVTCRRTSSLYGVWVAAEYEQAIQRLIQSYKYGSARHLSGALTELVVRSLPYLYEQVDSVIVAMPTITRHVRERGFDHSLLLAGQISKELHLPLVPALARVDQAQQAGATRKQRLLQLSDAIRPRGSGVARKTVYLVDDVMTTGASLEAAAKVLKSMGAKRVVGVVVARR